MTFHAIEPPIRERGDGVRVGGSLRRFGKRMPRTLGRSFAPSSNESCGATLALIYKVGGFLWLGGFPVRGLPPTK